MKLTDLYIAHKANVDFVVLGLAIAFGSVGFSLLGISAFIAWKATGTLVYAVILLIGFIMLAVALIPAYKMQKTIKRMRNENCN